MATLKGLVDETTNIKNELVECHSKLLNILTLKSVEVSEEDKLEDLIEKVDLFDNYASPVVEYYIDGAIKKGEFIHFNYYNSVFSEKEDCLYLESQGGLYNNIPIDVTLYNKMYCEVSVDCSNSTYNSVAYGRVGLYHSSGTSADQSGFHAYAHFDGSTSGKVLKEINISSLTGIQYVRIYSYHNYGQYTSRVKVYRIWLEK